MTSKHQTVSYSIRAPGVGFSTSGNFVAGKQAVLDLPSNLVVASHGKHNRGVYITTSSSSVTVIGGNSAFDSYFAIRNSRICFEEYVYYGILFGFGQVIIVGTTDSTTVRLTFKPQSVNVTLGDDSTIMLSAGVEHSLKINSLQTLLVELVKEIKIVADKPVSVFSGHKCGAVPLRNGIQVCGHMIEQIPPTALWGTRYYVAPLSTGGSNYTIKILAACNKTTVDVCCDDRVTSYKMHEGMDVTKIISNKNVHCVIDSNKKVLVVQYSHSYWDYNNYDYKHNSMMILVPSVDLYSNKFSSSTISNRNPVRSDFTHYINIIVLAQYHQTEMIHLIAGGARKSMNSLQWKPIKRRGTIEAYTTTVSLSEGEVEIIHSNSLALLTATVYGFANSASYGHSGGSYNLERFTGKLYSANVVNVWL